MLNVWGRAKKVEEIFGKMKNILYLCIVFRITDSHRGLDHRFTQRFGSQIHTEMIEFGLTQIFQKGARESVKIK